MNKVKKGDTIKVHYTGSLSDGNVFDTSAGNEPLEFTVGDQMVIFGFDNGVLDMQIGEQKRLEIPALEAYGEYNKDYLFEVPKEHFPEDMQDLTIGMQLQMVTEEGMQVPVEVVELKENIVVLDANHPLAGKDLIFDIELIEIVA